MVKITRRQFLTYLAGMVVVVNLPPPVIKSSESAEELAMRLWRHPTLSYRYSEDGKNWIHCVYRNITLPFSDGIVTLDSRLTTLTIRASFNVARRKVAYFDDMSLGIDWPKGQFHVPK